ncbi:Opacity protein [Thiorhodovibrio winogradskyi]|uniref:Opacity protein n=1 Tax=Thiorhodovibrio winogradskyi TaxID=77007 RepID=A0ABZ0S7X2_9GAMM|nr:outer membrane beta-barrel protein [Thiorhodovibrio winogradskyi]
MQEIRKEKRDTFAAIVLSLFFGTGLFSATKGVAAEGWYLGSELMVTGIEFKPKVRFANGRASEHFEDDAWGRGFAFIAGRQFRLLSELSLGAQARIAFNDGEWTKETTNTSIRYQAPRSIALSLLPEYRLTSALSAFGELGVAHGHLNYRKSSRKPDSITNYDHESDTWGYVLGLGLRWKLNSQLDMHASYRYTAYERQHFTGRVLSGFGSESFTDSPITSDIALGFRWLW